MRVTITEIISALWVYMARKRLGVFYVFLHSTTSVVQKDQLIRCVCVCVCPDKSSINTYVMQIHLYPN